MKHWRAPLAALATMALLLTSVGSGVAFAEEADSPSPSPEVTQPAEQPKPEPKAEPAPEPEPVKEAEAAKPAPAPQPEPELEPSEASAKEDKTEAKSSPSIEAKAAAAEPEATPVKAGVSKVEVSTKTKNPTQYLKCEYIKVDYHRDLTNGDHINLEYKDADGKTKQVNAYVDLNLGGYKGLGIRFSDGSTKKLTESEVKSGIIKWYYSELIGVPYYKVTFVQTNATDTWPNKECGTKPQPPKKDAKAEIKVKAPTCEAPGSAEWSKLENATGSILDQTPGSHSGVATANDGHLFPNGDSTKSVEYTIEDKLPAQSTDPYGPCYEPPYVPPTPEASSFSQHTCEAPGTYTIPSTEDGVVYMVTTSEAGGAKVRKYPGTYFATADGTATGTPVYLTITVEAWDPNNPAGATLLDSWDFIYTNPGDCTVKVTVTPPTFTPGTCQVPGLVNAVETEAYKWVTSGPNNAKVYTAVAKPGYTLTGQTAFGPYDTTQVSWKDPACKPVVEVEQKCTAEGGYVKITYVNNSKWDRWPDYSFTGDTKVPTDYGSGPTWNVVKVLAGETKVIFEKTFPEDYNDGQPIDVWYQDILGAERDIDTAKQTVSVETNCNPDPEPAEPIVTATCEACANQGQSDGAIKVTVTNTADDTKATVEYTVTVGGVDKKVTIKDGESGTLEFDGLVAGDYTVAVKGDDKTSTSTTVKVKDCPVPPTPVVPDEPTKVDKCEPADGSVVDGVNVPASDKGSYTIDGKLAIAGFNPVEGTSAKVVFIPNEGVVVEEGAQTEWTFTFTKEKCVPTPPPPRIQEESTNELSCEGATTTTVWYEVPAVWDAELGEWVDGPEDTWIPIQAISSTRQLTPEEAKEHGCVAPKPTPKPSPKPTPDELAYTGGDLDDLVSGAWLVLVGTALVVGSRLRRR